MAPGAAPYFACMQAPGGPGSPPSWGPGRKQGFGTAPGLRSRVWLTIARGNLSEVFFPQLDQPALHELRFLAAAPGSPPVDDAREATHQVRWLKPGIPCFRVTSAHQEYRLTKEFCCDPDLNAVVVSGEYHPELPDVRLFVQASAHVRPGGPGNDGFVLDRDPPVLALRQEDVWMVVVGPFQSALAGYLNSSDVLVDLHDNDGELLGDWSQATSGNAAVGARLGIAAGAFQLAIGFAHVRDDAEEVARQALRRGAGRVREQFEQAWRNLPDLDPNVLKVAGDGGDLALASVAVLRSLEDKTHRGAFIASPAAPWGEACTDGDQVYHLVWTRDLFHIVSALHDMGDASPALRALEYLAGCQRSDGAWDQNFTLDGTAHWTGIELDEVAYPILLAWRLGSTGALETDPWPDLVRPATRFLLANGPVTSLDRWEDDGGLSPSTMAACIAALVAAAEFADDRGEHEAAQHLRAVADYWHERVDPWLYVRAFRHYVRLNPDPDQPPAHDAALGLEFVELFRLGLRAPGDPRIEHSLATADALLKTHFATGPAWRRYIGDAYGESAEGKPWTRLTPGVGRPWPLLTAERAHRELARQQPIVELVAALEGFAGPELMLPEQVWDAEDIPERELYFGHPTGSVAPLGWAHGEYLKLLVALASSRRTDAVAPAGRRYAGGGPPKPAFVWHPRHPFQTFPTGRTVVVQAEKPGSVRWTADGWASYKELPLRDTTLDLWVAALPTDTMRPGAIVEWTTHHDAQWEGVNHSVRCVKAQD